MEQAKARGWEAEQREKNVHLVEALLAKRPATNNGCSCNLGADHWKCVQQKRKMYLVKWANCGEESNSWVCERNVGKAAIKAYEDDKKQKAAGRRKHKGELAAAIVLPEEVLWSTCGRMHLHSSSAPYSLSARVRTRHKLADKGLSLIHISEPTRPY